VLGAGVEHDVVNGDVEGVLVQRGLDLVGRALEALRALDVLVHMLDIRLGLRDLPDLVMVLFVVRLDDLVVGNRLVDLNGHGVRLLPPYSGVVRFVIGIPDRH